MKTTFCNLYYYDTDTRTFKAGAVSVCGGRITEIHSTLHPNTDAAKTVDLGGSFLLPGLVDVHTHGRGGFDFNDANLDSDKIDAMLASYAKAGTTSLMATLASAPFSDLLHSCNTINQKRGKTETGARILGIHMEGRYLNSQKRGAHPESLLAPFHMNELEELFFRMCPLPAHISAAPELEGGEAFFRRAAELGLTIGIAHSDSTYEEAIAAIEWGASAFTHTCNAMRPLHHRDPGTVGAALTCNSAYAELICDGMHLHPGAVLLAWKAKPSDKIVLITDSMEAAGCPDGDYQIAGSKVTVKDGKALTSDGALAGSTLSLFKGLCNFMDFCSIPLEEALPCATMNPAKMIRADDVVGSIEAGKFADFIVIDDVTAPKIRNIIVGGNIL